MAEDPTPGEREWRVLPEFPKYEIDSDGQIRNRRTKRALQETEDKRNGSWYYSLWVGDNLPKAKRSYERLLYSAWPEFDRVWKTIPGYENYEISKDGKVRGKLRMQLLKRRSNGCYLLRFRVDGQRRVHNWCEGEIGNEQDWEAFWNEGLEEIKEAA